MLAGLRLIMSEALDEFSQIEHGLTQLGFRIVSTCESNNKVTFANFVRQEYSIKYKPGMLLYKGPDGRSVFNLNHIDLVLRDISHLVEGVE